LPEARFTRAEHGDEAFQLDDRGGDVVLLAVEHRDPLLTLGDGDPALLRAPVAQIIKVDHLADVGQAEPDILGPHDPGQPRAVAARIDRAVPCRVGAIRPSSS
jgi:hypothetical protein